MLIRPAELTDAAELARVHIACWRETYPHLLSTEFLQNRNQDESEAWWLKTLALYRQKHRIVVLESDGELLGFAQSGPPLVPDAPRQLELFALYLREKVHGTGAGQSLMDAAVGDAPAQLWIARDNRRADAFYRRNGFRYDGARQTVAEMEDIVELRMVR